MTQSSHYAKSGVDIDAGNEAVDRIKPLLKRTQTAGVLQGIGGFSGAFQLPSGYKEPVLMSCTDGVGTKLRLAIDMDILEGVGVDLVAMCVNDLICSGAKPLFFLDYVACHKLVPAQMERILEGMVSACEKIDTAIVGGEMAEMNDMYQKGDFDLAGFSVGIVEKSQIIDGSNAKAGDKIYGIPSSGVHSNGYSLLRKVLTEEVITQHGIDPKSLLEPTRIYVNEVLDLIQKHEITALAHITGGGLIENVERVLPEGVSLNIDRSSIPVPEIFQQIQKIGNIPEAEMGRVFNMGIGMVIITPDTLTESEDLRLIGHCV